MYAQSVSQLEDFFFCGNGKLQVQGKKQQDFVRKGACVFYCISFGDTLSRYLLIT